MDLRWKTYYMPGIYQVQGVYIIKWELVCPISETVRPKNPGRSFRMRLWSQLLYSEVS